VGPATAFLTSPQGLLLLLVSGSHSESERLNNTNKSVLLMKKMSAIYLYFPSSILVVSLMLMQLLTTQAKNSELSHDVLVVILSLECSMHLSSIP